MKKIIFLILLFCSIFLISQNKEINALKNKIDNSNSDSAKIKLTNELIYSTYLLNSSSYTSYIYKLISQNIQLSKKINFYSGYVQANYLAGNIYKNYGKYNIARTHLFNALSACNTKKDSLNLFKINNTIGSCYYEEGNYPVAAQYYFIGLKCAEQTKDKTNIANAYNSLGNLYKVQKEYIKSIFYHRSALKFRLKNNDSLKISFSYVNLGDVYNLNNMYDSARFFYSKALIIQTITKNTTGRAYSYNGIGNSYFIKGYYLPALDYYKRANNLLNITKEASELATNLICLAKAYQKLNDTQNSFLYFYQAQDFAIKIHKLPELKESYFGLFSLFETSKKYEKALEYHKLYLAIADSIFGIESNKKIASLEHQYQLEQEQKIQTLKDITLKVKYVEELAKQKLITWSILIIFLIVLIFSIFIYKSYKNKKIANLTITKQKIEVEKQKHLLEEKQKEILDSIHYAKRIQNAMLPKDKFIERKLKRL